MLFTFYIEREYINHRLYYKYIYHYLHIINVISRHYVSTGSFTKWMRNLFLSSLIINDVCIQPSHQTQRGAIQFLLIYTCGWIIMNMPWFMLTRVQFPFFGQNVLSIWKRGKTEINFLFTRSVKQLLMKLIQRNSFENFLGKFLCEPE